MESDDELPSLSSISRVPRALTIIVLSIVTITVAGIAFLRPPPWFVSESRNPSDNVPASYELAAVDFVTPTTGWVVMEMPPHDFSVLRTVDAGETWTRQRSGAAGEIGEYVHFFDPLNGVLVPLGPGINFDTAKLLVELLGRLVTEQNSSIATMERRVNQRGPRVYVDTGQTGPSRTIVAPYSVRAYPGATVSAPISWQELHVALDTSRFTMLTMPGRIVEVGDPYAEFMNTRPDVPAAVAALSEYLRRSASQ